MPILSEEDLERFRTKVCALASSMQCDFGVERCNYSHNLYWARRCPFYLRDASILRYVPACCPDVELGPGSAILKNTCPRGNNCAFAHSLEEMNYHPLVYKTEICGQYREGGCRTYYCHKVHGLAEYRIPRDYVIPRRRGITVPPFEHVTIVDNVRNFQGSGNVSCHLRDKLRFRGDQNALRAKPSEVQQTAEQQVLVETQPTLDPPVEEQVVSPVHIQGHVLGQSNGEDNDSFQSLPQQASSRNSSVGLPRDLSQSNLLNLSQEFPEVNTDYPPHSQDPLCASQVRTVRSDNEGVLDLATHDLCSSEKLSSMRWTQDIVEPSSCRGGSNSASSSSGFPAFLAGEESKADGSKPRSELDELSDRVDEYTRRFGFRNRANEQTCIFGDDATPWYDRGSTTAHSPVPALVPTPPYTLTSYNTMLQESLQGPGGRPGLALREGTLNDPLLAGLEGRAKVVRNVNAWNGSSVEPRSLSLQCASELESASLSCASRNPNSGLLDYVYHTVTQQCDAIARKCVLQEDNYANIDSICNDAYILWQLVVSVQSLLYRDALVSPPGSTQPVGAAEGDQVNEEASQWGSVSSFYSELAEAYEYENSGASNGVDNGSGSSAEPAEGEEGGQ
ncbi:zinc finger, CCCH type domain-containing protein [Babesia caballi]|uniref:Zinc finger, CCCH type domain-containing protein n=1 Tax=Babesia caballi TaxID=5871 RepID=A0AAV4LST1_BABCB|nr:zinc finger, CCCH type domain-containing protein [Babesia caballi]